MGAVDTGRKAGAVGLIMGKISKRSSGGESNISNMDFFSLGDISVEVNLHFFCTPLF